MPSSPPPPSASGAEPVKHDPTHAALSMRWRAVPEYDVELDDVEPGDDASIYYTHPTFGEIQIFEGEFQLMQHIADLHNATLSPSQGAQE